MDQSDPRFKFQNLFQILERNHRVLVVLGGLAAPEEPNA